MIFASVFVGLIGCFTVIIACISIFTTSASCKYDHHPQKQLELLRTMKGGSCDSSEESEDSTDSGSDVGIVDDVIQYDKDDKTD